MGWLAFVPLDHLLSISLQAFRDLFRLTVDLEQKPSFWRYYKTKNFRDAMAAFDVITK